jgi:hypothetical protein
MLKHSHWMVLVCVMPVLACGSDESSAPGVDTTRGSGGRTATGSGGSTPTGSGGTTATGSGGSSPTGSGGMVTTGTGGAGGAVPAPADASDTAPAPAPDAPPAAGGPGPFGCTNCKPLFDGTTLNGWETRDPTNWLAKEGVLASQGKVAPIWTTADLGNYRLFFKVRQVMGNHKPDVIFFGKRPGPGAGGSGALGGAQFQPPNGGSWNYGAGGTFARPRNPGWDEKKWHHCEVLVKEAGSFQAACCPTEPAAACELVLTWKGVGRKHPFAIQMHNAGLFDEYKDILIEENPTVDELLSLKK